jgi:hypothetical protein
LASFADDKLLGFSPTQPTANAQVPFIHKGQYDQMHDIVHTGP